MWAKIVRFVRFLESFANFQKNFSKRNFIALSHPTVDQFTATYRTTLYESNPDHMADSPPNEENKEYPYPLDPDPVFGLLGWQINF